MSEELEYVVLERNRKGIEGRINMADELTEVLKGCNVKVEITVTIRDGYGTATLAKCIKESGGDMKPAEAASFIAQASERAAVEAASRMEVSVKTLIEEKKLGKTAGDIPF